MKRDAIPQITFGSVCSGIEAASVAWNPLGWKAAWLSEIEPFPCSVLDHHYPDVPNLGDMARIPQMLNDALIPAPDIFCGGTPCQAFSIAGLRKSLGDARGNLSLTFCEIANGIDARRAADGLVPAIVFWENVPGVLNTKDNAFGCFLAGLAGEDDPLVPAGKKWTNAGCVFGPARTVAWRILDAQYFGLAQRRRRVFVVASARDGFDPAAVLFEFDGVRRDTAPSRQAREVVTGTISSRTTGGGGLGTDFECAGGLQPWPAEVAPTLNAAFGSKLGLENQHISGGAGLFVPALIGNTYGIPGNWIGRAPENGGNSVEPVLNVAPCLTGADRHGVAYHADPIAFDSRQDPVSSADVFGALGSSTPQAQAVCVTGDVTHTLKAEGFDASEDGAVRGQSMVACAKVVGALCANTYSGGMSGRVDMAAQGYAVPTTGEYQTNMAVRRLTPVECARLQGFPGDYLGQVMHRGKPAADGPMYKALGNSWPVPVVRWIGSRINNAIMEAAC